MLKLNSWWGPKDIGQILLNRLVKTEKVLKEKRGVSSRALVHYLQNCYRELNALVSALVALPITLNGRPFCLNVFIIGHPAP